MTEPPPQSTAPSDSTDLRDRLANLEREVTSLRRRLQPQKERLPKGPFDALQVRVRESWFLLPLGGIQELIPRPWADPLPDAPPWVVGTFRYGDVVVPLFDLSRRLFGQPMPLQSSQLVVLYREPRITGLLVDSSGELVQLHPSSVAPVAESLDLAPWVIGSFAGEERTFLILSPARLSSDRLIED